MTRSLWKFYGMVRIRVKNKVGGYYITEVTPETYKIIERKVIESIHDDIEMQTLLQTLKITLAKLMETSITVDMVEEAILESSDNLRNDLKSKL